MRSPRFRRVPFIRNGVSDHGRAVAPRISVRNVLPSTISTRLGLCNIKSFAAQYPTPHDCCVRFATVVTDDHATLATGRLATALPSPDFHRLEHASFAWRTEIVFFSVRPIVLSLARSTMFSSTTVSSSNRKVHRLDPLVVRNTPGRSVWLRRLGPSRHWGIMPLWQRPGLHWRSGQIDAQTRHRACRCRLRSGLGAADRRHLRDHRICCDLFMRRLTRKFAVPSVIDVPTRRPARYRLA